MKIYQNYFLKSMIIISSGNLKGKKLFVPEGRMVRPSSGRTRAAIFNTLQHRFDLRDFLIWDAYAGSGSLGLEAFSRGASPIVFTEKKPANFKILIKNLEKCALSRQCAHRISALQWLDSSLEPSKIMVFLDPPYQSDELSKIIQELALSKKILTKSVVIAETDSKITLNWPSQFILFFSRKYGRSKIEIAEKLEMA